MSSFKDEQAALLAESGWARCPSVAELVASAGLPAITAGYLDTAFDAGQRRAAEDSVAALREHFAGARFAGQVRYGVLLVPDPGRLDTRRPVPRDTRRDQPGAHAGDVFDRRLPAGALGIPGGTPWSPVATVTGVYGPSLGCYRDDQEADDQAAPGGRGCCSPGHARRTASATRESYRSCGSSDTTGHWRVPGRRPGGG